MATVTLDSDSMLLAGVRAFVTTACGSLLPAGAVRSSFPNADLVTTMTTGGLNPLVVVDLGMETELPRSVGEASGRVARPPILTGATTSPVYIPQQVLRTVVTITIVASGDRGKPLRGQVKNAIAQAVGSAVSIPLPDSAEQGVGFTTTTLTTYGLTAQLTFVSGKPDNRLDEHLLYRYDLAYHAEHTRYTARVDSVVQGVGISVLIPTYR